MKPMGLAALPDHLPDRLQSFVELQERRIIKGTQWNKGVGQDFKGRVAPNKRRDLRVSNQAKLAQIVRAFAES